MDDDAQPLIPSQFVAALQNLVALVERGCALTWMAHSLTAGTSRHANGGDGSSDGDTHAASLFAGPVAGKLFVGAREDDHDNADVEGAYLAQACASWYC